MSAWKSNSFISDARARPLPTSDITFFHALPTLSHWFRAAPHYTAVSSPTREARTDGENDLFALTLATASTIPHWLLLVHDERVGVAGENGEVEGRGKLDVFGNAESPDMVLLMQLEQGVNGFKGVAHGGLLCALLDEGLSYCVEFARQRRKEGREELFTANLNVDFRRPVLTPGVAVLKCWVGRVEGRKYWVEGQVEDGDGQVSVQAKGLWIEARPAKA